jgi:hypothetical protein
MDLPQSDRLSCHFSETLCSCARAGEEFAAVPDFTLQAADIRGPLQWKWTLLDQGGMFVADHPVSLNGADWRYEAFLDLHGYLRVHASPDHRRESERQMIAEVGRWRYRTSAWYSANRRIARHATTSRCGCWPCSVCRWTWGR